MNDQHVEPQEDKKPRLHNAKKILIILAISLIILLPTIFAVILTIYSEMNDDPVAFEGVEVALYDADRNELFRESGDNINNETDSLVKILCAINDNREKGMPSTTDDTVEPLIARITRDGVTTELTCYFSFYSGQSFCVDSSGETYVIPDMYSEYFTHSIFAEPLYETAVPPTLNTTDGGKILPQRVEWNYWNESSQWLTALLTQTTDSSTVYDCIGGISLSFSQAPTSCVAKLYEQTEEIYYGDIDGISSVSLSEDIVKVVIVATWDKEDRNVCYGTQIYNFFMRVHNKASFSVSADTISENRPVIVCANNVEDLSSLIFTSEDTSFKPQFHLRGTTAFALIPLPADAARKNPDEFSFTLSYGVVTETFTLSCDPDYNSVNADIYKQFGINPEYFNSSIEQIFINGAHAKVDTEKFTPGNSFGEDVKVGDATLPTPFTEYLSVTGYGHAVRSFYAGKVAFVGNSDHLGTYVIIDLGLDVKLWYCFLGETYVKSGDIIAVGEIIGTTDKLVIRDDRADGFAYIFTYLDYIISPEFIFENNFSTIK